ncbi:MAG: hypothetical protein P1V51_12905 [Deltaproteobacteria bacterium]|nr:hypothetical protein [Deltaproteobacteria bacterium]
MHRAALALLALLLLPAAVSAEPLERATAQLASAQRDAGDLEATWTWKRDGKTLAPNSAGLVALSLVRAWERSGSDAAREAALRWGDARVADLAEWRRLFDPDVEALAELGRVSGNHVYTDAARQLFERRWSGATAEEVVGRLVHVRERQQALIGYDLALVIRAARAVGEKDFAGELARQILARPVVWEAEAEGRGWATTSRAALLGALNGLPGKDLSRARGRLAADLVKAQEADGSWAHRNTQATAYAVEALTPRKEARSAVKKGRAWLTRTQLTDGSWAAYHDGLPEPFVGDVVHEVTAEVVLALAAR